jgi:hypothetical protein
MKEALSSSKTSVLARAMRRNIAEDTILHSHGRENLKFYIDVTIENKIVGLHHLSSSNLWHPVTG